jgi:holliday junction DNA helicase RuvA
MIARLLGTLLEKQQGCVIVDVGGVGYEVIVPLSTYDGLGDPGSRVELYVHTHVREDALALFGFRTRREKDLFARLIGVNGVGPKTAIAALSGLGAADLLSAVRQRDIGRLSSIPGIGRKTAERILLELADRLDALETDGGPVAGGAPEGGARRAPGGAFLRQDLVSALVNLGYNPRIAADAAGRVLGGAAGSTPPFETLLRDTLKLLSP